MKAIRFQLLLSLFLCVPFSGMLFAAADGPVNKPDSPYPVYVRGKVYNDKTGSPIRNHAVDIGVVSLGYTQTRMTDNDGWYADTIPAAGPGHTVTVSTLDCHQELHTQSFLSIPTVVTINFAICDSAGPVECHALFTPQLDSLNREPNTFLFYDRSSGFPNHWYWQFGDGATSADRNPVHRYTSGGTYRVCLYITREEGGAVACLDSLCMTVTTPEYHDLGGHLFAGDLPINNPVSTGDTGIARIYRITGNRVQLYDSIRFTTLGYFAFPRILAGTYMIHAALSENSVRFGEYFPMYYASATGWVHATRVDAGQSNAFDLRIDLMKQGTPLAGPGTIPGKVTDGELPGQGGVFAGAGVFLMNSDLEPVRYTTSGPDGSFRFEELPYGNYSLYADFPGKYSRYTGVALVSPATVTDTVWVELFDHDVTALPESGAESGCLGNLLPNPAGEEVRFSVCPQFSGPWVDCSLFCLTGEKIAALRLSCPGAPATLTMRLDGIRKGIYLLRVTGSDGTLLGIKKVIKM